MDYLDIETLGLAQLGKENYKVKAHFEIGFIKEKILQLCGELPKGMRYKTAENQHDFGTYYSLQLLFNESERKHERFVEKVDALNLEADHFDELQILWENVSKIRDGLKDYHTADENVRKGYDLINQFPGKAIVRDAEDRTDKPGALSVEDIAESHGMNDMELLEHYAMDSVVPACCEAGCQVEPDGHCEHGHESILLAIGII